MQLISHGQSSSLKASFEIELGPLDLIWCQSHSLGVALTKYSWVVQLISHGQSSSLKASFEIELGPLDFNKPSNTRFII